MLHPNGAALTCCPDIVIWICYYRDALGLDLVSSEPDRYVFFHCGRQMVLLFHPDATSDPDGTLPPYEAYGSGHVAFSVEDEQLGDRAGRLRGHGITIEKEMTWGEAGRSLYVRDPAGNSIELATPMIWPVGDRA